MKPIIFSAEMVRAIIDGRKTQTRRVVKGNPRYINPPYGSGDILWVRETWAYGQPYWYKATDEKNLVSNGSIKWRPSIHMPRAAARLFLRVTGVRVERLHDISDADAHAEGMDSPSYPIIQFKDLWRDINDKREGCTWDGNPLAWVVGFERVKNDG